MRRRNRHGSRHGGHSRKSAEHFGALLQASIPAFVFERLRPLDQELKDAVRASDEAQGTKMHDALASLSCRLPENADVWNQAFAEALMDAGAAGFAERMQQLPEPPEEPAGLWDELLEKAGEPGETGAAACLLLYNLGCARAFRSFRQPPPSQTGCHTQP